MGLFSSKKEKQFDGLIKALSDQATVLRNRTIAAQLARNLTAIYPTWDIGDNAERYATTDDVYSIIRMLVTTAALIPIYAYQVKEDQAAKKLKRLTQPHNNIFQTKALELKALVELPENDKLNQLLENPHATLSKFEWFEYIYLFLLTDGEAFILKERPDAGANEGLPVRTHLLFPKFVTVKVTDTFPRRVVAYDYIINGKIAFENIPPEDIIHIKLPNPDAGFNGEEFRGLSTVKVLKKRLALLDSNLDITVAQMQNGGVQTIVYDKAPSSDEAKEINGKRKQSFYNFLKDPANAGAPFFAAGEMGVLSIGTDLTDLKVIESANITFKKLCNAFGTSDQLFNNDGHTGSENSIVAMVKRTYTNTTLPLVYRVRDALIKGLIPDFEADGKKRDIREDISEIRELQEDSKALAEWLNTAWWVTPNEKREMMKFEVLDDELFDKPIIPAGLQSLDELTGITDLPIVTTSGN